MRNDKTGEQTEGQSEKAYDEKDYFESFYRSNVRGQPPRDSMTIGSISEMESRFHYNAVENAIIRTFASRAPLPRGAVIHAWRAARKRAGVRLLDVGSGTGHWIDFFADVFAVPHLVGVEIVPQMLEWLRTKYADNPGVSLLGLDVTSPAFTAEAIGGPVDLISAIGVMFHLVDDARWEAACRNLAAVLKPGGTWYVGGDFGQTTHNSQFHTQDVFESWSAYRQLAAEPGELRVNKRLRSLATWASLASDLGLEVVDLVRAEAHPAISTPENDVLVLQRRVGA